MNLQALLNAMNSTAAVKPRPVQVEGWGTVYVRALTVAEAEDNVVGSSDSKERTISRGIARVLCDEKGQRFFDPDNETHIDMIRKQPWPLLTKILAEAEKLSPASAEAVDNVGKR